MIRLMGIVKEAKKEMHEHLVRPILNFCGTFSFWNQKNLSSVIDDNDVVILVHVHPDNLKGRYWIEHLKIYFKAEYVDVGSALRVWPDGTCYGPRSSSQYDIIKQLLDSDVDGKMIIASPSWPLMLIASEIRRLFTQCHYYTRLTLLCIHRWRKESLVGQLPRDVLIYLLKNFIV